MPAQPFPFEIWLSVNLDNIPKVSRRIAKHALVCLRGWSTGISGETDATLRYRYTFSRAATLPAHVRGILRKTGATSPHFSCFVIWRQDVRFREPLDADVYGHTIQAMKMVPEVLDVHGLGNDSAGVYIEFRGKPSAGTLQRIESLARPYVVA